MIFRKIVILLVLLNTLTMSMSNYFFVSVFAEDVDTLVRITTQTEFKTLPRSEAGKLHIIIENISPGTIKLNGINIDGMLSNLEVTPDDENLLSSQIAPTQSIKIPYTVSTIDSTKPGSNLLFFDIKFERENGGGFNKIHSSNLAVQETSFIQDVDKMVRITTEKGFETLYESDNGSMYIIIENISGGPITLNGIEVKAERIQRKKDDTSGVPVSLVPEKDNPSYLYAKRLDIDTESNLTSLQIRSTETVSIPYDIETREKVHPGKNLLFFNLKFTGNNNNEINKMVPVEVDVQVSVTENILSSLGVPSFSLLPGFMFLVLASIFSRSPINWSKIFDMDLKNPMTWVFLIIIGVLTSRGITFLLDLLVFGDLPGHLWFVNVINFKYYGLWSVLAVYVFALFIAFLVAKFFQWGNRKWRSYNYITVKDKEPLDILRKINRKQKSLVRDRVNFLPPNPNPKNTLPLLLQNGAYENFICPQMEITLSVADAARNQTINSILSKNDINEFLEYLEELRINNIGYSLEWLVIGQINGSLRVVKNSYTLTEEKSFLVVNNQ